MYPFLWTGASSSQVNSLCDAEPPEGKALHIEHAFYALR